MPITCSDEAACVVLPVIGSHEIQPYESPFVPVYGYKLRVSTLQWLFIRERASVTPFQRVTQSTVNHQEAECIGAQKHQRSDAGNLDGNHTKAPSAGL